MHSIILTAIVGLAVTALAHPHSQHHDNKKHKNHAVAHVSATGSGMPFPIANATTLSRHVNYLTSTEVVTVTAAGNGSPAASTGASVAGNENSPAGNKKLAAGAEAAGESAPVKAKIAAGSAAAAEAAGCNSDTVTVTVNPTTTVTVSPAASGATDLQPGLDNTPKSEVSNAQPASSSTEVKVPVSPAESSANAPAPGPMSPTATAVPNSGTNTNVKGATGPSATEQPASSVAAASSNVPSAPATNSPAPAADSGIKGKRGILAGGKDQNLLMTALSSFPKITWVADWDSAPPNVMPSTMTFIPQCYGRQSDKNNAWTSNAKQAVAKGTKYFLGFGEPNTGNPDIHMEPQEAVDLFMAKMQPYADQGVSVGSPGILQDDLAWLAKFLDLCDKAGCKIGFVAMHWVWSTEHASGLKDMVGNVTMMAKGKPVWVDNFEAAGPVEDQKKFMTEIVPWLEAQPQVARYAYSPSDRSTGHGFINQGDGKLSELGQFYANL